MQDGNGPAFAVNTDPAAEVIADDIAREISTVQREIDPSSQQTAFGQVGLLDQLLTGPQLGQQFSVRFLEDRRLPLDNGAYVGEMNRQRVDTRSTATSVEPRPMNTGLDELVGLRSGVVRVRRVGRPAGRLLRRQPGRQPGTSDTRWLRELEPYRYGTSISMRSATARTRTPTSTRFRITVT